MTDWRSQFIVSTSPVESKIARILNKLKVRYEREVSFRHFKSPKGGYYRFDFYFPDRNMILEYDGSFHLKDKYVMKNDKIKNKYCKKKGIKLVRLNKKHLKTLEQEIKKALK